MEHTQGTAFTIVPITVRHRFKLRISSTADIRSIALIGRYAPKQNNLINLMRQLHRYLDDCFRGAPLELIIVNVNNEKLVIQDTWQLFSRIERSYPPKYPAALVEVNKIPIPGSKLILHKYGTDTMVNNNDIGITGDVAWATLLSKKSNSLILKAEMIDIRHARVYSETSISIHFEDLERRCYGARLTEPKMGFNTESYKLYIPPDGQLYMIEVEYVRSRFIDRVQMWATSPSNNEDEVAGTLTYQTEGERKNSKRRKTTNRPKAGTPRGYICLPCREGESIVGLYGRNDNETGWLTELGLITAPVGVTLPDEVYTMPEFNIPDVILAKPNSEARSSSSESATTSTSKAAPKDESEVFLSGSLSTIGREKAQDSSIAPDLDVVFASFRIQMRNGNEAFIRDCITRIQEEDHTSEPSKLAKFGLFYFGQYGWPPPKSQRLYYPRDEETQKLEQGIKQLTEATSLLPIHCDGTHAPVGPERAEIFVEELSQMVFYCSGQSEYTVQKSEELERFLQLTAGVTDPDFRRSGICSFLDDLAYYTCSRSALRQALLNDSWTKNSSANLNKKDIEREFEVLGGILAGEDKPSWDEDAHWSWQSWYLYCRYRQTDENSLVGVNKEDYKHFKWRVIFACTSFEDWDPDGPLHIFNTISEFLQWYGSWYERDEHKILLNEHLQGNENGGDRDSGAADDEDYEDVEEDEEA